MAARLVRITVYPIKSLDGVEVSSVAVLPGGALEGDRRWAIVDANGMLVNSKRTSAVQVVRAAYDLAHGTVRLGHPSLERESEFSLVVDRLSVAAWLSEVLGLTVSLQEDATSGFPDDSDAPGPTLLSTATLRRVASWFPNMTIEEARRRFRANLEFDGLEPFDDDRWFGPEGSLVPLAIGDVVWGGTNPCQRCVVPTRDSRTGAVSGQFAAEFTELRERRLSSAAERSRFNHFYRLAVNTRLLERREPGLVRVGDELRIGDAICSG